MNEAISMKWIEVYDPDDSGKMQIVGYICSKCGFYTRRKLKLCPFCKKHEQEDD